MTRSLALAALAAVVVCAGPSCRAPTEITVAVSTDFPCSDLRHVTVSIGTLGDDLERRPATSTSTACADGYAGSIVVIPSAGSGDEVGIKVVAGFATKDAEDCQPSAASPPDYGAGCIVARRALRYLAHTRLTVPVVMRSECAGIACGVTETCVDGGCVPATISDPKQCEGAGCDEGTLGEGGAPPDANVPTVYNDITDPKLWSSFDMAAVNKNATGYAGGAFDGRYVYFVPWTNGSYHGHVMRVDSRAPFTAPGSWALFDTQSLAANPYGFYGAVFDGRYLYLVPYWQGKVARYDTRATFADSTSWDAFDMSQVDATAVSYWGGAFDGRYVYFAPYGIGTPNHSAVRYDTKATFSATASWQKFDVTGVKPAVRGYFQGAVFDGRYVTFVPNDTATSARVALHYDTQAAFDAAASWSTFDVAPLGSDAFGGAAFDGRFLYFAPGGDQVTRFDTQGSFTAAASWSAFGATSALPNAGGFVGDVFDGRFVYFAPFDNGFYKRWPARYDTQGSGFQSSASWSTFDMTALTPKTGSFNGAAFDGRYVYFVPYDNTKSGVVARFDAKSPPSMPSAYHGSFL